MHTYRDDKEQNEQIRDTLARIESRMDSVDARISNVELSCTNMDNHISFIEHVYNAIKYRFWWLLGVESTSPSLMPRQQQQQLT